MKRTGCASTIIVKGGQVCRDCGALTMGQVPYGVTELTLPSSWYTHSWAWLNVMKIWVLKEGSGVAFLQWPVRRTRTAWSFLVDRIVPWVARPSPGLRPAGFTWPGQMHRHLRFSSFNTLALERARRTSGSLIRLRKERLGQLGAFSRATQRGWWLQCSVIPALLHIVHWGSLYVCPGVPDAKLLYGREMHVCSPAKWIEIDLPSSCPTSDSLSRSQGGPGVY